MLNLSPAWAAPCFKYGPPAKAQVSGRLFKRTDWGPPNYGEDPAHDSHERHTYIRLDKLLCVVGRDTRANLDEIPEMHVSIMELAWDPRQLKFTYPAGRHLLLFGWLFHGDNGHHYTRVLLFVSHVGAAE